MFAQKRCIWYQKEMYENSVFEKSKSLDKCEVICDVVFQGFFFFLIYIKETLLVSMSYVQVNSLIYVI